MIASLYKALILYRHCSKALYILTNYNAMMWRLLYGKKFSSTVLESLAGSGNLIDKDRLTGEKHTHFIKCLLARGSLHKQMKTQRSDQSIYTFTMKEQ